jgi:hypothetical protein
MTYVMRFGVGLGFRGSCSLSTFIEAFAPLIELDTAKIAYQTLSWVCVVSFEALEVC